MIRRLLNWLFPKPIEEGIVVSKTYTPARPPRMIAVMGSIPLVDHGSPERYGILFAKDGKQRGVVVSKECWDRYQLGDTIKFDN